MTDLKRLSMERGTLVHYIDCDGCPTLVSEKPSGRQVLLNGRVVYYRSPSDWLVHGGITTEQKDFQALKSVPKAVLVTLLLKGELHFGYDRKDFNLSAMDKPTGIIVNIKRPASFTRTFQKNQNVTKLNISLPIRWLEELSDGNSEIQTFLNQHLNAFTPSMTPEILDLVNKIIGFGTPRGLAQKLEFEMLTHQLLLPLVEQLSQFTSNENARAKSSQFPHTTHVDRQVERAISYIDSHLEQPFTVDFLANYTAMSPTSLQRKFKAIVGYSVQSYIRFRRLELARKQLENGRITITEAAYNAGYRHPANFTKAFKKAFGTPPMMSTPAKVAVSVYHHQSVN